MKKNSSLKYEAPRAVSLGAVNEGEYKCVNGPTGTGNPCVSGMVASPAECTQGDHVVTGAGFGGDF